MEGKEQVALAWLHCVGFDVRVANVGANFQQASPKLGMIHRERIVMPVPPLPVSLCQPQHIYKKSTEGLYEDTQTGPYA